jgi:hypothetical protein
MLGGCASASSVAVTVWMVPAVVDTVKATDPVVVDVNTRERTVAKHARFLTYLGQVTR